MPLSIAPIGERLKIRKISADLKVKEHLKSLGIVEDVEIILLSLNDDSAIVSINGSKLALDKKVTNSIFVSI